MINDENKDNNTYYIPNTLANDEEPCEACRTHGQDERRTFAERAETKKQETRKPTV